MAFYIDDLFSHQSYEFYVKLAVAGTNCQFPRECIAVYVTKGSDALRFEEAFVKRFSFCTTLLLFFLLQILCGFKSAYLKAILNRPSKLLNIFAVSSNTALKRACIIKYLSNINETVLNVLSFRGTRKSLTRVPRFEINLCLKLMGLINHGHYV